MYILKRLQNQIGKIEVFKQTFNKYNRFTYNSLKNPCSISTKLIYNFSQQNMNNQNIQQQKQKKQKDNDVKESQQHQEMFSNQQQQLINSYKPNQTFNIIMNKDQKYNFQKELIVARKQYQKNTKDLRNAILFQDLLKSQVNIPIYDTQGKIWIHHILKTLFLFAVVAGSLWAINDVKNQSDQARVIFDKTKQGKMFQNTIIFISIYMFLKVLRRHIQFKRRYVQKIVYNTQNQNFTFVKRNFIGLKRQKQISRFKIMYTQNQTLNKLGTNYFHIDTQEQYSIAYKECWLKQDLFSHLISQRIKI